MKKRNVDSSNQASISLVIDNTFDGALPTATHYNL